MTLTDYSTYHRSAQRYSRTPMGDLSALQKTILKANRCQTAVRVRGNGHSMNGSSLPRTGELLIETPPCDHFRFDREGTITVGSGAAVWDVNQFLVRYGYELLVYNDGGAAAATVGGYLSAGGFGAASGKYGGFWETVEAVTLVTGDGRVLHSELGDSLFPWLFGSMGQLGVFFEVTIRIQPRNRQDVNYPPVSPGRIQRSDSQGKWPPLVWYTLFVPTESREKAKKELEDIGHQHRGAWQERPPFQYDLPFIRFNPPLVHSHQGSLVAVGIWGTPRQRLGFDFERLRALETDIMRLLATRPRYRRYFQTELALADFKLRDCLDQEVYVRLVELKRILDPRNILARGVICPAGGVDRRRDNRARPSLER
jgi:FAD/FMN-containing dehydrogenase